ncbi:spore coat protein [Bacillus suaedae]|uniref:Spore coat protein n=1 Tax=Halalkalibacter suaedae TaxID=2822140 RepID=A0A941APA6_9BACI|nr:spore coat protein [Bacillus suaedae]MBP3949933.1 spore coat protein [Bacillus suaedae]
MSKKIQNPEMPVPKTPQMSERDFLNDQLTTEKYMTNSYSVGLNELSNNQLYLDISSIFNETQNCQREVYNVMFRKGFYSLEAADQQKLSQTYQQFSGYTSQFPYQQ